MHRSQQSTRATRTPPPVPATYHTRSQSQTLVSLSAAPESRPRRPSISSTMHWLSRTNSPPSTTPAYAPSKPIRVPEPKRPRAIDIISPRSGVLGSGATVVRTPDEALRETGVRLSPEPTGTIKGSSMRSPSKKEKRTSRHSPNVNGIITPAAEDFNFNSHPAPHSPPLPPLPTLDADDEADLAEPESPGNKSPPRPNRPPPPPPSLAPTLSRSPSLRSSMKVRTISTIDDAPMVPPLPSHVVASNQPPPFSPILISDPPSLAMDASKTIVTIETCTQTFKTTLSTVKSRPSYLSKFLASLFFHPHNESMTSLASSESDDLSTYRRHLTSQGLMPHSTNIHIFLDRDSAPYTHILAYLRSPVVDGQPEMLPRGLRLQASTAANIRLENLIEVRDEAAFLALDGLQKLCTEEIRLRYGPRMHVRGQSGSAASMHSQHASIYSSHTLAERGDHLDNFQNVPTSPLPSTDTFSSTTPKGKQHLDSPPLRGPPTPQSWEGPLLDQRSQSLPSLQRQSLKTPPAGWI